MMHDTAAGKQIEPALLNNYFKYLVNQFFKILPMRENEDTSLQVYLKSLQAELLGCNEFVCDIKKNASFMTLLSMLQYMIDRPDCPVLEVRREVFRAISICNRLKAEYAEGGVTE